MAVFTLVGLAFMAIHRGKQPAATTFWIGNLTLIFYAMGTLFEIHAQAVPDLLAAIALEYVGIATVGPLWFLTIWFSKGDIKPFTRAMLPWFFVIPLVIIVMVATNQGHGLFYSSIELQTRGPFTVPILGKGPIYLMNMVYMNLFLVLGTLTIFSRISHAPKAYRRQYQIMGIGSLFPWGLDLAPFGLVLSGLAFAIALFRYGLFELRPLVVDAVFESIREGVMILDLDWRLVGINPGLLALVPGLDQNAVGLGVAELQLRFPALRDWLGELQHAGSRASSKNNEGWEPVLQGLGGKRFFQGNSRHFSINDKGIVGGFTFFPI